MTVTTRPTRRSPRLGVFLQIKLQYFYSLEKRSVWEKTIGKSDRSTDDDAFKKPLKKDDVLAMFPDQCSVRKRSVFRARSRKNFAKKSQTKKKSASLFYGFFVVVS